MSTGTTELLGTEGAAEETGLVDGKQVTARSPLQLFWRRFRRDRVALVAAAFVVLAILVAIFAPLIVEVTGAPKPNVQNPNLLDDFGSPTGPSADNFLGVDQRGRDVFSPVIYTAPLSLLSCRRAPRRRCPAPCRPPPPRPPPPPPPPPHPRLLPPRDGRDA